MRKDFREISMMFLTDLMKKHLGEYVEEITKLSSFSTNQTTINEKQISLKRKVQTRSPSTSGQSGYLVLNPNSIETVCSLPNSTKHIFSIKF